MPAYSASIYSDLQHGFYADTRGQISEYERIAPPHEENIPALTPTQTTTPFTLYCETNFKGRRQPDYKVPLIPDYNVWYHDHPVEPYSKEDYVRVWCPGKTFVNGVDCITDEYAITFVPATMWLVGIIQAHWKARRTGKKAALFCYVNDIAVESDSIEGARLWSKTYHLPIFFGTIDAYLPYEKGEKFL